jgi:hypothetical protein
MTPSTALVIAALAALLAPLALLALTPTVSWDAGAYHLTLPRLYLEHGGFREVPLNVYSYWPQGVQLLYALALAVQDHVLAKLLHFAFGVATLWALAAGCRTFHRPASGALAAILFLANGVVAFELRVAYVDLAHAFLLLAGLLFMLQALERDPRVLWLSGLCCGLPRASRSPASSLAPRLPARSTCRVSPVPCVANLPSSGDFCSASWPRSWPSGRPESCAPGRSPAIPPTPSFIVGWVGQTGARSLATSLSHASLRAGGAVACPVLVC